MTQLKKIKLKDLPEYLLLEYAWKDGRAYGSFVSRTNDMRDSRREGIYDPRYITSIRLLEQPADDPLSWRMNLGVAPKLPEGLLIEVKHRKSSLRLGGGISEIDCHDVWNLDVEDHDDDIIAWRIVGVANGYSDEMEF